MDHFNAIGACNPAPYSCYQAATQDQIPNYWELASKYVLSDETYGAIAAATFPNRLYSVAASAGGFKDNPRNIDPALLPRPNLADRLDEAGLDWACYMANVPAGHEPSPNAPPFGYNPITYYPERRAEARAQRSYDEFLRDAAAEATAVQDLPDFAEILPAAND